MENPSPMCSEIPGMREMRRHHLMTGGVKQPRYEPWRWLSSTWIPKFWLRRRISARNVHDSAAVSPHSEDYPCHAVTPSGFRELGVGKHNPFTNSNLHYYGRLHSAGYPLAELRALRLKTLKGYSTWREWLALNMLIWLGGPPNRP